ncbi:hypothetical protein [Gloeothece verrucosa]|uniref:PBS lyase HEAT domain protein repeat-containing protein n=1 Tax=Gloeothece verrucosa (strain PCC 7822) TaxID=497965 RepID=E0UD83_GLOV7|nr:hypothetical protein [Gloeothece verrucosa]ADN12963.1 conserved hypothetical protein [Gloeothece verrucosa PCC 7822]
MSSSSNYCATVSQLLTYQDFQEEDFFDWPDYLKLGLSAEHIPQLIEMATDEALYQADAEASASWAPILAWRTLAQLKATQAISPLLKVVAKLDNPDEEYWEWIGDELPKVFLSIGVESIPILANYLSDVSKGEFSRIAVIETLQNFPESYPEVRNDCICVLTEQLKHFQANGKEANGFIVLALVKLNAIESADLIEQAYEEGYVDEAVVGDWEEIQILFGLIPPKTKTRILSSSSLESSLYQSDEFALRQKQAKSQAKKQKKRQKEARRKNRAKKK